MSSSTNTIIGWILFIMGLVMISLACVDALADMANGWVVTEMILGAICWVSLVFILNE